MQVYIQCKGVQMQSKIKVFLITNKCRYIFNVKVYKFITENKHTVLKSLSACMNTVGSAFGFTPSVW